MISGGSSTTGGGSYLFIGSNLVCGGLHYLIGSRMIGLGGVEGRIGEIGLRFGNLGDGGGDGFFSSFS